MKKIYEDLGFDHPTFLENKYGIKIYIGTENEDDWCVEVPKELCKKSCSKFKYDNSFTFYCLTEDSALEIAKRYTMLARS